MSKALPLVVGEKAKGTAELLLIVDRLFDCLNSSNVKQRQSHLGHHNRCADEWKLKR